MTALSPRIETQATAAQAAICLVLGDSYDILVSFPAPVLFQEQNAKTEVTNLAPSEDDISVAKLN